MLQKSVIIYRDRILGLSETFILSQCKSMKGFRPLFVCSTRVDGLDVPYPVFTLNKGDLVGLLKECTHKALGLDLRQLGDIRLQSPEIIHAHFGPDGVLSIPLSRRLKLPLIVTFHGFDATVKQEFANHYSHKLYFKKRFKLISEASLFIAVSDFIRNKLIEQGFPENKILRHYIGIDTDLFKPDSSILREPIVLFVGRLVEQKGLKYLINAMEYIQQKDKDIELVVIGDGPLRNNLEVLASNKLNKYRFLGSLPQNEVRFWMNKSKVFCVPSIVVESGASEGFGLVFIEASSMGLPAVSFSTGGIPEAIRHEKTGFLAPTGDNKMLAKYIMKILEDSELWQRLSDNGMRMVRRQFNLKIQTEELESIYEDIISKRYITSRERLHI